MAKYDQKYFRSILITLIIAVYLGFAIIYYTFRHHFIGINDFMDALYASATISSTVGLSYIEPITYFGKGLVISNIAVLMYILYIVFVKE